MSIFYNPQQITPDFSQMNTVSTPAPVELPPDNISAGGFKFTIAGEPAPLPVPSSVDGTEPKKRRGRPRKNESGNVENNSIIRSTDGAAEVETIMPTAYSYQETTNMLRGAIYQIDELSGLVKQELDSVRANRTLKRKHDHIVGLSSNLGQLINTKISAIREINSSISKSNDLDYKREKDIKASTIQVDDDKHIMDMYTAFVQNPMAVGSGANVLGPNIVDTTIGAEGIIRASTDFKEGFNPDMGYLSYVSQMTPEQNLMRYENNPNVKQVVVYDASTGNKFFQVMDMSTGQVIPNVPTRSQMFMEDTTIDLKNRIAKNINLNETYPLVVINEGVTSEY